MSLDALLKSIKKTFDRKRDVDFEEFGLHFEIRPVNNFEETKIMESIKDVDPSGYLEALKRNSLACSIKRIVAKDLETGIPTVYDFNDEIISYQEEDGTPKKKSKFLYMIDFLKVWPTTLIDVLFDAHNDLHTEIDVAVRKSAKFERFAISDKVPEDKREEGMERVDEDSEEEMDESEALRAQVEAELDQEDAKLHAKG